MLFQFSREILVIWHNLSWTQTRPTLLELFPNLGQIKEYPDVKEICPLSPHTHSIKSWLPESCKFNFKRENLNCRYYCRTCRHIPTSSIKISQTFIISACEIWQQCVSLRPVVCYKLISKCVLIRKYNTDLRFGFLILSFKRQALQFSSSMIFHESGCFSCTNKNITRPDW